ncbi:NTPase [Rhizobium leguminosarum bv. viciae]|nr:NTPase [Rhizobium leguminosarum bv. viciae]
MTGDTRALEYLSQNATLWVVALPAKVIRRMFSLLGRIGSWFVRSNDDGPGNQDFDIGADTPIRAAKHDLLRRGSFTKRIASILSQLSLEEGRIFAIRGPWGSGKSSLKNLVIEELAKEPNGARWLEFNPWQWGEGDVISKALFQQIAGKLDGPLSTSASKRAAMLRRYGAILNGSGSSFKSIGKSVYVSLFLANASVVALATSYAIDLPKATTVASILAGLSIVVPFLGRFLVYLGKDPWAEPLDKVRSSLETSLRRLKRPLIIFVDDIDRLEPEQIRMLIRQIKVNANLPNLVFVMLFQPSIVESALDPITNNNGREFLKKIVQANFDLPAVPRSLVYRIMTTELSQIASHHAVPENGFESVRWGNALIGCIQPFVGNLRDSRRYTSSISIHLPLHVGVHSLEVNIIDFLCLEALRVFEPDFHAALFERRDLVLQLGRFGGDGLEGEHKSQINELIESVPDGRREVIRAGLKLLFPKLEWALDGAFYGNEWQSSWSDAKRVCSSLFFQRYFELQTAEGDISANEFEDFIKVSGDRSALDATIASIEERGLLPALVTRLDESVKRLPAENGGILLPAMFRVAEKLVDDKALESPWVSAWRAVSWYIEAIPANVRGDLTLTALRETGALSVAATIIHLNDPDAEENASRNLKLDAETVSALKSEWLRQIIDRSSNGMALLSEPDLISYLYRWRDYSGSTEAPHRWLETAIGTNKGLARLLPHLVTTGRSHTMGDLVSSASYRVDVDLVKMFIGTENLLSKLKKLPTAGLDSEQQEAFERVEKALKLKTKGTEESEHYARLVGSNDIAEDFEN